MEKPQFSFKGQYVVTQSYDQNANNYPEGHHGGLDIVPLNSAGVFYPADIFNVFSGRTLSVANVDPKRGKGIKVRSDLNEVCLPLIPYLKSKGLVPLQSENVWLDTLHWHCLEVTDLDGQIDQATPVAKCGNTGWVFSQGSPVPDHLKGVPPYPGGHEHLEMVVGSGNTIFNLDKDPRGRIDPLIIINFKTMFKAVKVKYVSGANITYGILVETPDGVIILRADKAEEFANMGKGYGVVTANADGSPNFDGVIEIIVP